MPIQLRKPTERVCEQCGRHEVWDQEKKAWQVAVDDDGNREAGNIYCIHEWDINGDFVPFESEV